MAAKLSNLCKTCKENEIKPARCKRKFTECESCRSDKAKKLMAARGSYRRLKNHVNRLVSFYECGRRHGYLLQLNRHTAVIQPIGPIGSKPDEAYAALIDVMPCESAKYPTLQDWSRAAGWKEGKVKPVIIIPKSTPVGHAHTPVAQTTPVNGTLVSASDAHLDLAEKVDVALVAGESWSAERAVALYQGGMKVSDIAACFGDRNKQNRVRKACRDAGVYQGK